MLDRNGIEWGNFVMDGWNDAFDLAKKANPLWMHFYKVHYGSLLLDAFSMENNMEFQKRKLGDFVLVLDLADEIPKYWTVEAKVQSEFYYNKQEDDYVKILFEETGNVEAGKKGSSFWDTKADLYSFAYFSAGQLMHTTVFYVPETRAWLRKRIDGGAYPIMKTKPESNSGLYTTEFRLVPLKHIPDDCISVGVGR